MTTRRTRGKIVMAIDPGTLHTGVCIVLVTASKNPKFDIQHLEVITTKSNQTTKERFDKITKRLQSLIEEFEVTEVICEAFEVRTWQQPRSKSTVMSKLINAISQAVFEKRIPFMLSSPDIKRSAKLKELEDSMKAQIYEKKTPYFTHAQDAIRHALYHIKVGSK